MKLLDCPFCGNKLSLQDIRDTVYPNSTGWIEGDYGREYVSYRDAPKEQWCYKVVCQQSAGGCDAELHGDTEQEAIEKWNTRV